MEEEIEEELDLTDLGPNPTPQMIEMKKKQIAAGKKSLLPLHSVYICVLNTYQNQFLAPVFRM